MPSKRRSAQLPDRHVKLDGGEKLALVIQSALELIPCGLGSALSQAVFGTMVVRQRKRIELMVRELADQLTRQAGKIDKSYFDTDEFQTFFRRCFERAVREHQEVKLASIRNLLARNIIDGAPGQFDLDVHSLEIMGSLTRTHILCLRELARPGEEMFGSHTPKALAEHLQLDVRFVRDILTHLVSLGLADEERGLAGGARAVFEHHAIYRLSHTGRAVVDRISPISSSDHPDA